MTKQIDTVVNNVETQCRCPWCREFKTNGRIDVKPLYFYCQHLAHLDPFTTDYIPYSDQPCTLLDWRSCYLNPNTGLDKMMAQEQKKEAKANFTLMKCKALNQKINSA